MSANGKARPSGDAAPDLQVHIGRLVIDRAALGNTGVRGLHEAVIPRIAKRLESAVEPERSPQHRVDLSDAIAAAVAEQLSPRLHRARLAVRLKADATRRR
jgi:hypothetical protein